MLSLHLLWGESEPPAVTRDVPTVASVIKLIVSVAVAVLPLFSYVAGKNTYSSTSTSQPSMTSRGSVTVLREPAQSCLLNRPTRWNDGALYYGDTERGVWDS